MSKHVYAFAEGNKDLKDLLGGKGANLAEMTGMGLPVPPGFIVSTEACHAFLDTGSAPSELSAQVDEHLAALEKAMGKTLGAPEDPLLASTSA
jgi:pyruvate, orthophosphate dikinase